MVICENVAKTSNAVCTTLAHEMIHAFDDCRAKVNFKNLDHLACTEVGEPDNPLSQVILGFSVVAV